MKKARINSWCLFFGATVGQAKGIILKENTKNFYMIYKNIAFIIKLITLKCEFSFPYEKRYHMISHHYKVFSSRFLTG